MSSAYVKLACGHSVSRDRMAAVGVLGDKLGAQVECPKCHNWQPIPKPPKKPKHTPSDDDRPLFLWAHSR